MANEDAAKDPKTPPEVLAMLSTSPSEVVRLLIAQNPGTPETALRHLAQDTDDQVRRAITHRAQVSSEVLRLATLPRDALEQLDDKALSRAETSQSELQQEAQFTVAPTPEISPVHLPAQMQEPVATPAPRVQEMARPEPSKKPALFAWFWRLFGGKA